MIHAMRRLRRRYPVLSQRNCNMNCPNQAVFLSAVAVTHLLKKAVRTTRSCAGKWATRSSVRAYLRYLVIVRLMPIAKTTSKVRYRLRFSTLSASSILDQPGLAVRARNGATRPAARAATVRSSRAHVRSVTILIKRPVNPVSPPRPAKAMAMGPPALILIRRP